MPIDTSKLTAAVAPLAGVVQSVKTLLGELSQMIANLATDSTDEETQANIDALAAQIQADSDQIAQAVVQNTPAAPKTPPTPPTA